MIITPKFTKDSMYSLTWLVIYRLSALVGSIILANLLSPVKYGLYADLMAWGLILSSFLTLGLPSALTKIISENKIKDRKLNGSILFITFIIMGVQSLVVFIFNLIISNFFIAMFYFQPFIEILFILIGVRLLFSGPVTINQGIFTGFKELKKLAIIMSVGYIIRIPLIFGCILVWDVLGAFVAEILINVIFFCLLIYFLRKFLVKEHLEWNWKKAKASIRPIYSLSLPIFLTVIFPLIANWVGFRFLGMFHAETSIGIFQIAFNLVSLLLIIPTAIIAPFLPHITEHFNQDKERFRISVKKICKFSSLLLFPAIITIGFLSPFIILVFYPKYYLLETFTTLFILTSYSFLAALITIYLQVLIATTSTSKIILFEIIKSGVQLFATFVFVPLYGLYGLSISFLMGVFFQYSCYIGFFVLINPIRFLVSHDSRLYVSLLDALFN